MKRLFALILAVSMLLSMASVGFAEDTISSCDHDYEYQHISGTNKHQQFCKKCGEPKDDAEECTEGSIADGKCGECGAAVEHKCVSNGTAVSGVDSNGVKVHGEKCDCGKWVKTTTCTFNGAWVYNNGADGSENNHWNAYKKCDEANCDNTLTHEHQYGAYEADRAQAAKYHTKYCSICGSWKNDYAEHSFDCKGICTVCGYKDEAQKQPHTSDSGMKCVQTEKGHKWVCETCGEEMWECIHEGYFCNDDGTLKNTADGIVTTEHNSVAHWYLCTQCNGTFGYKEHSADWTMDNEKHSKTCTICNVKYIEAAHSFPENVACNEAAQCSVCKKMVAAAGHKTPADFNANDAASHWKVCTKCGEEISGTKAAHTTVDKKYDENCKLTCDVCKATYADETHKEHVLVNKPGEAATCSKDGNTAYAECTCGYMVGYKKIPAYGDSAYVYELVKDGGCGAESTYIRTCKFYNADSAKNLCDHSGDAGKPTKVEGVLKADGTFDKDGTGSHVWDAGVKTAADCCNNAYTTYTCDRCGKKEVVVETNSALGHLLTKYETKWFTTSTDNRCEMKQVQYKVCARCGCKTYGDEDCNGKRAEYPKKDETSTYEEDIYVNNCNFTAGVDYEVLATKTGEHKYGKAVEEQGDCTMTGAKVETCEICGYEKKTAGTNTGKQHALVTECTLVGELATCTKDGKYYYQCKFCSKHLNKNGVVDAATLGKDGYYTDKADGHHFEGVFTAATCKDYGYTTYTCNVKGCGKVIVVIHDGLKNEAETDKYLTGVDYTAVKAPNAASHVWEKGKFLYGSEKCGEKGWYEKVCKICGEIDPDNDYEAANEHAWALDGKADEEPSCKGMTKDGTTVVTVGKGYVKCTKCGEREYSNNLVAKLNLTGIKHNIKATTVAATCEEDGMTCNVCTICGDTFDEETLKVGNTDTVRYPKLGHSWNKGVAFSNCAGEVATKYTCTRCGQTYVEGYNTNTHGKTVKVWKNGVEANCEKGGYYAEVCSVCGQYVELATKDVLLKKSDENPTNVKTAEPKWTYQAASGHSYDESKTVTVAATCVSKGYTTKYCTSCKQTITTAEEAIKTKKDGTLTNGTVTNGNVITTGGHKSWEIVDWKIEGNCTKDGKGLYGCPYCGAKAEEYVEVKAGHKFPSDAEAMADTKLIKNVLIAPTCSETGLGTTVCERCGAKNDKLLTIPATGKHNFGTVTIKADNCEDTDKTYYYCVDCKATDPEYKGIYLDDKVGLIKEGAKGKHSFGSKLVTREATCEKDGGDYKVCTKCGYEELVKSTKKALGHKASEAKVTTKATCYQAGEEITYCLRCDKTLTTKKLAKLNHKLVVDKDRTVEATCIANGLKVEVCENEGCDYEKTTYVAVNENNHVYVTDLVYYEVDCKTKENGVVRQHCKYHNDKVRLQITSWTEDHDFVEGEIVLAPTCESNGTVKITCSKCGMESTKTLKKVGHNWATREVEATCEKGGYTEVYCTVCEKTNGTKNTSVELGHNFLEKVYVAPTCKGLEATEEAVASGKWVQECARCGKKFETADDTNPATAKHEFEFSKKIAATCKDYSYDLYVCKNCGVELKKNEGDKLDSKAHKFMPVDETIKVPACDEEAIYVYAVCSVCGEHRYEKLTAACEFIGPFVAKNGNTITAIYNVCKNCGKIELLDKVAGFDGFDGCMTIGADGEWTGKHTLAGGVVTDATCEEAGHVTKLYCTKCGTLIADEAEIAAKGHTVVEVAEVPATCTEDGVSAYSYCSVCNKEITKKEVLPAGHKLVEVEAAVEATCTEDGKTASKKCENCDYVEESKVVPAKGHKEVILPAVEPTESSTGLTEGKKCETCGLILVEQKEIAAKEAKLIVPAILRAAGYDKATTVARLYTGAEVKILEAMNENGYYKVEVAGKTGYMHKSYIEIL